MSEKTYKERYCHPVQLRLDDATHKAATKLADKNHWSMAMLAKVALEQFIAKSEK